MLRLLALSSFLIAAAACGGKTSDAPTTPEVPADDTGADTTGDTGVADTGVADTDALHFYEGDTLEMTLEANGDIKLVKEDQVVGNMSPDNVITAQGAEARLADDGTITVNGQVVPFRVSEDGAIEQDGERLLWFDDDGSFSGPLMNESRGKVPRMEGATSAEARRRAMFLLLMVVMPATDQAPDEVGEVPAEAAPPADGTP